jgi:hypothetical protein
MPNEDEIFLKISEDGVVRPYEEPYFTIEFKTEAAYNQFCEMVNFWNEHHAKDGETDG